MAYQDSPAFSGHLRPLALVRCPKCSGQLVEDEDSSQVDRWWRCLLCSRPYNRLEVEMMETVALGFAVFPYQSRRRRAAGS